MPRQIIVSPLGLAEWAKVIEPGEAYEKENPAEWTLDLVLDPNNNPAHLDFISQIELWFQELHGSRAKVAERGWPFRDHLDAEKKPDGLVTVRFKRTTISRKGNPVPAPVVVDAKKKPWNRDLLIGNGSKVKVGFAYYGWERGGRHGISLDLSAVQVLDLVPYEMPDPTGAFAEEDGYEVEEAPETAVFSAEPETASCGVLDRARRQRAAAVAQPVDDDDDLPF